MGAALAGPFHVTNASGYQGSAVGVSLLDDSTQAFEAATLLLSFDSTRLEFLDAQGGSLADSSSVFPAELGAGLWIISLAAATPASTGKQGSLLAIDFRILDTAALGDTAITLGCSLPYDQADPNCSVDYDVPPTTGFVTVLARPGGSVPEPSSLALMGALGAGAVAVRRRKRSI